MAVLTPKLVIQLTAFIAFETGRKVNFVGTIANIYLAEKKNWALLTNLLKVKNNMFLPHTKT